MRYSVDVEHAGLKKFRRISGTDRFVVEHRAQLQCDAWNEQWRKHQVSAKQRTEREKVLNKLAALKTLAVERTAEAEKEIADLRSILTKALTQEPIDYWEQFKDRSQFSEPRPKQPNSPIISSPPERSAAHYQPQFTLFDRIISSRRAQKSAEMERKFLSDFYAWQSERDVLQQAFAEATVAWESERVARERREQGHCERIHAQHLSVDERKARYLNKEPHAIEEFIEMVLGHSEYPECCPQDQDIWFSDDTGILLVDYKLPSLPDLPKLKQVRYVASKNALEETEMRPSAINTLYDDVVYQICLRAIFEIFSADGESAIRAVVFNGWVEFTDPATGKDTRSCILSLSVDREAFLSINLTQVEPKACFRALNGVGSSKLHGMAAIAPIMRMNKSDARFVESKEIAEQISEGTNVATIGWEDFEHLIREIFEKEFSREGADVKVTRASRDGGVDAIVFDPDPLRGGKIVIQAKRYTNTVDVSAVRDLYGTVMNEGAIKGILVTTSSFGPDAYSFARDKPITLLDGGNLLHLLERHGHQAYIDLAEAKKLNIDPFARSTKEHFNKVES